MIAGTIEFLLKLRNELSEQVGKAQKDLKALGGDMTEVGKIASVGLSVPLGLAGAAAVKFATDMNASMANVATLIPGNVDRVRELKGEVQDLAVQTGKSTGDLAGGLYQVVSAFGDTADTAAILNTNARAAAAGLSTTTEAINLTSAVTKGYGDTSAAAVQHAADLALMTVRLGQTDFPQLAASMGKVIPIAQSMGATQEEMFAVFATATGVTGSAAEVATQYRGVLAGLINPTEDMTALLREQGFESGKAMLAQRGLVGTLQDIVAAAEASGQPITKYVSSIEAVPLALALAGPQADTFAAKLGELSDAAGATDAAFKEQTEGINAAGFAWEQMKQKGAVALQQIGDVILPILLNAGEALAPLADLALDAARALGEMPRPIQAIAVVLGALLAAAGPVLVMVGSLVSAFATLAGSATFISMLTGIGSALGLLVSPIGLVVAGVGALYLALDYFGALDPIIDFFKDIGAILGGVVVAAFREVKPLVVEVGGFIGGLLLGALNAVLAPFKAVADYAKGFGTALAEWLGPKLREAREQIGYLADKFRDLRPSTEQAEAGLKTYRKSIEDMKIPTLDVDYALGLIDEQNRRVAGSAQDAAGQLRGQAPAAAALAQELEAARAAVAGLTGDQRTNIAAGVDLGKSVEDVAKAVGVSEAAVRLYKDQLAEARTKAEEAAAAQKKFLDSVTPTTTAFVPYVAGLEDAGVELQNIAAGLEGNGTLLIGNAADTAAARVEAEKWAFANGAVLAPSLEDTSNAIREATTETSTWGATLGDFLGKIPGLVQSAFTGGGGLGGAIKGIVSAGGQSLFGGWFESITKNMTGALGAIMPGLGQAIGSLIGPLVSGIAGLFSKPAYKDIMGRVGRDWGVSISENLAKSIADNAKDLFHGDRQAAEIFNLDKIIGEAGGLSDANVSKMLGKLHDVFSMIEVGKFSAAQATEVLDANFAAFAAHITGSGDLASRELLEIIELDKRFGTESAAVAQFVQGQMTAAIGGLQTFAENATITSQAGADGVIGAVVAMFDELQRSGAPLAEVIASLDPIIASVSEQLESAGLSGGEAFDEIRRLAALAGDEVVSKAITAVGGLNQAMIGLNNSGLLNQTTFQGLARQVSDTFAQLVEQGHDGDDALRLMQPTLQTLWTLQQDYGYEVDESTQAMLDQAEAAGVVGDAHREANERAALAMERVAETLDRIAAGMGFVASTAASAADSVEREFRDRAIPALEDTADSIRDVIEMHSPTGLEGIAHYAKLAGDEMMGMGARGQLAALGLKAKFDDAAGTIATKMGGTISSMNQGLDDLLKRVEFVRRETPSGGVTDGNGPSGPLGTLGNGGLTPVAMLTLQQAIDQANMLAERLIGRAFTPDEIAQLGERFGYQGEQALSEDEVDRFLQAIRNVYTRDLQDRHNGFAVGTLGRFGEFFHDFGPAKTVEVHGREAIVRPDQAQEFARRHGGGGGDATLDELRGLRRDMRGLPDFIAVAVKDAVVLAGRGR
ncbi:MAG: phage tail tape measure protein [Vicinamibacterales bacterium]